mgnify:CR=1 FL=1
MLVPEETVAASASSAVVSRAHEIALDVFRHAFPLVPFYLTHGSVASYLLLTAFDLTLGFMLIVGTTRDLRDPTTVDPRSAWLISRPAAGLVLSVVRGGAAAVVVVGRGGRGGGWGWGGGGRGGEAGQQGGGEAGGGAVWAGRRGGGGGEGGGGKGGGGAAGE